ncbi:hypothetical protein FOA52_011197 [Chlamydomonas sp. UWO 241]|nr:hypothetical protein FOA52_011197 [Chlamydomonas sp. UWO 241]
MQHRRGAALAALLAVLALMGAPLQATAVGGVAVSDVEVAALSIFPFCACDTYRCNDGPFRLDYLYTNATVGEFGGAEADLVFQLHQVPCPATVPCCPIMLQNFGKLEIEVRIGCAQFFLGATINGERRTAYYDTENPTGKIRITPPLQPSPGQCDCLSPIASPKTTRWSVTFVDSRVAGTDTVFEYRVALSNRFVCDNITFREGNCCDQTLDGIVFPVVPSYVSAVTAAVWTTAAGVRIQSRFWQDAASVTTLMEFPMSTTSLPDDGYVVLSLYVSRGAWASTASFPCPVSQLAPDENACDYELRGSQTLPGQPTKPYSDGGLNVPACCPEGVTYLSEPCPPACNANTADSAYTLSYVSTVNPTGSTTRFTFSVDFDFTQASKPCGGMAIGFLMLTTNPSPPAGFAVVAVSFAGVAAPYIDDTNTLNVDLSSFAGVQPSTLLEVDVSGVYPISTLCTLPWFGAASCPYTLAGVSTSSSCCPAGAVIL